MLKSHYLCFTTYNGFMICCLCFVTHTYANNCQILLFSLRLHSLFWLSNRRKVFFPFLWTFFIRYYYLPNARLFIAVIIEKKNNFFFNVSHEKKAAISFKNRLLSKQIFGFLFIVRLTVIVKWNKKIMSIKWSQQHIIKHIKLSLYWHSRYCAIKSENKTLKFIIEKLWIKNGSCCL